MCLFPKCYTWNLAILSFSFSYFAFASENKFVRSYVEVKRCKSSYNMEELGASDQSLVTILALIISALVLGCKGKICRILFKYLQNFIRAGTETLTVNILSQRVRTVNTVVTQILNIKASYNLGYS